MEIQEIRKEELEKKVPLDKVQCSQPLLGHLLNVT